MATFTSTLFSDYMVWMINQGATKKVAASYASYLRVLFRELYNNGYLVSPNTEALLNSARRNRMFMLGLEAGIEEAIDMAFAEVPMLINEKKLRNGRSSFRRFVRFTETLWNGTPTPTAPKPATPTIKATAPSVPLWGTSMKNAAYILAGLVHQKIGAIKSKAKNRLGTQDRVSGDKTWFPIRLVKQILGKEWFDGWTGNIIKHTKVHIDACGNSITLTDIAKITLDPSVKGDGLYDVSVTTTHGTTHRVYTHNKDGRLTPMSVSGIDAITIEHCKAINDTLVELGGAGKLPELDKLSDLMKKARKNGAKNNGTALTRAVNKANPSVADMVDHEALKAEMELIAHDTDYELMEGKENSRKGAR